MIIETISIYFKNPQLIINLHNFTAKNEESINNLKILIETLIILS